MSWIEHLSVSVLTSEHAVEGERGWSASLRPYWKNADDLVLSNMDGWFHLG